MKNFKVRCMKTNNSPFFTEGNVYGVIDGILIDDDKEEFNSIGFATVEEINMRCRPQFELVEQNYPEIYITTDGRNTYGVMKLGKEVLKRVEAKLHPDDDFDFEKGVELVKQRLFEKEKSLYLHNTTCKGSYGELGETTNFVDVFGNKLCIGDTVIVYKGSLEDCRGEALIVKDEKSSFVMGLAGIQFTKPAFCHGFMIVKQKDHKGMEEGMAIDFIQVKRHK